MDELREEVQSQGGLGMLNMIYYIVALMLNVYYFTFKFLNYMMADKAFNLPQILLDTSSERSTEFNPDIQIDLKNNLNRLVNGVPKSRTPSFSLPTVVTLTNEQQHTLNNPEQSFQPSISKNTMKLKGVDSIC